MASTLDGVRAPLPNLTISDTSKPTEAQALRLMTVARDWATSRIGDLTVYTPTTQTEAGETIDRLVELGTAALVYNAAFPERAGVAGGSYGDWLWTQFLHGIDELLESLNKPTADTGGGQPETPVGDKPAFSAPDPMFYRDTGF